MSLTMLRINHAGNLVDNPVLEEQQIRLHLNKHDATVALRKCWISVGDSIFKVLTARVVEADEEFYVDVVAGVDLQAAFPAALNVIHWTTTNGHVKAGIYVATFPTHMVELDGYDGRDPTEPLIWALYPGWVEALP